MICAVFVKLEIKVHPEESDNFDPDSTKWEDSVFFTVETSRPSQLDLEVRGYLIDYCSCYNNSSYKILDIKITKLN